MRNKKTQNNINPRHHLPMLNFSPSFRTYLCHLPEWHKGMGNGVCSQSITAPRCHSSLLTLSPTPARGLSMGTAPGAPLPLLWPWCSHCSFSQFFFPSPPLPVQCFALSQTCSLWGGTILPEGLRHVLWWVHWSWLGPAVSNTGESLASQRPPLPPKPCHLYPL